MMRTMFQTPKVYEDAVMDIVNSTDAVGTKRPENFKKVMRENRGSLAMFSPFDATEDGLERKNPVIVALGDSVTAGHFEFIGNPEENFKKIMAGLIDESEALEVTDARECYLEKFRLHLIDLYEQTSVSTINAGIAGDDMYGMQKRLYRDVIRYQPDLVIINGSLNWPEACGDTAAYEKVFREVVATIKAETKADIVLMTPNMELPGPFGNSKSTLDERVEVIRRVAKEADVCLADTYKIWKIYESKGYPIKELLANGGNHPSIAGHELFARVLMQLIR